MSGRVGSSPGPADQHTVREHNLGFVLRHVAVHGSRSRAQIAQETGLNKTTVSSLVAELIERRLLTESGTVNLGSVGRPGRTIRLAGDGVAGLGLEVGEGHLQAMAVDLVGRIRYRSTIPVENRELGAEKTVERLASVTRAALAALAEEHLATVGMAVAVPGLVENASGTLFVAPNLGWTEVPITEMLARALETKVPIQLDNDANLAALAELNEGAGRGTSDFVFLYGEAGVGVGAGIVAGGELFRGRQGLGGEVGHMPLVRRGPLCRCGNRGCLEVLAGLVALLELAGVEGFDYRDGSAQQELVRRARADDRKTIAALAEVARVLAMAVTSLTNVLNPGAVILGGYYSLVADWLVPRLERELATHVLASRWSHCDVLVSALGREAAVRGAAALALQDVLANPARVQPLAGPLVAAD